METGTISERAIGIYGLEDNDIGVRERLDELLRLNRETASSKSAYASEQERTEAEQMVRPITSARAYSIFGLQLGLFGPAALMVKIFSDSGNFRLEDAWVLGLVLAANLVTGAVGFFSGKLVGKIMLEINKLRLSVALALFPLIGMVWGGVSGFAGGLFLFIIGSIFGAAIGAMWGGAALTGFALLHRYLKRGDMIERKHFLPISFGVTFLLCAFILGL